MSIRAEERMYDGIINVYKEKGFTSHDVVAKMRGILGQRKIGHTGTLDPAAKAVLQVCAGKGTKLCDMLTDHDKTYRAVLLLGTETDTEDTTGTVIGTKDTSGLTESQVREAVLSFIGDYDQVPPMYSALKVDGKKLYELAREGKRFSLLISIEKAMILMAPVIIFAPFLASLFTNEPEVLTYGIHFIRLMMPFYLAISFNQIFANALRGAGNSVTPMVIMMGSFIVFRQIYLYFISKYFNNITATALGYPLGWVLCSILLIIYYWKVGLNVKKKI